MTVGEKPAVAVLGAGAFGTALANAAGRAGRRTLIWARDASAVAAINGKRSNEARLPGARIHDLVSATGALEEAARADMILLVVPAQALRGVTEAVAPFVRAGTPLVICAKGIERGTGRFMSEVVAEAAPAAVPAVLSGPGFAADIEKGLPTALTVAAEDDTVAKSIADRLGSSTLRLYHTSDLRGVEIGGATKNVLAIAAGVVSGRLLGASAVAALTARGFAELTRFGRHFGARAETLMGLSGLGDLMLTCSSVQSRNFAYGVALGKGEELSGRPLAEGVATAYIAARIARERGLDAPIIEAVAALLDNAITINEAVAGLMTRPLRAEAD